MEAFNNNRIAGTGADQFNRLIKQKAFAIMARVHQNTFSRRGGNESLTNRAILALTALIDDQARYISRSRLSRSRCGRPYGWMLSSHQWHSGTRWRRCVWV